jgi:hypothetical protein
LVRKQICHPPSDVTLSRFNPGESVDCILIDQHSVAQHPKSVDESRANQNGRKLFSLRAQLCEQLGRFENFFGNFQKKFPEVNNRPMGKNSSNLFTLSAATTLKYFELLW